MTLQVGDGTVASDASLCVTDDFSSPGDYEFDLRDREALRYELSSSQPAHVIRYTIGLRATQAPGGRRVRYVEFTREDTRTRTNPRTKDGIIFTVYDETKELARGSEIEIADERFALQAGSVLNIHPPEPARQVVLTLSGRGPGGRVVGVDNTGNIIAVAAFGGAPEEMVEVSLEGECIAEVRIETPEDRVWLGSVSLFYTLAAPLTGLRVRAWSDDVLLNEHDLTGSPGDLISGRFDHDRITAVEFTGGDAALVELCYALVHDHARWGWDPVPDCPQPIALPVRHKAYPASGRLPTDRAASEATAVGRVRLGDPSSLAGTAFANMHDEALLPLVRRGPSGPSMNQISQSHTGIAEPPEKIPAPKLQALYPLQLLTLGALNAPVAQALGLYWVDETAEPGTRYDYMIVADHSHSGLFAGDVNNLLGWLTGPTADFSKVDAWIAFDLEASPATPLKPPQRVEVYALPGGTIDRPDGTVLDATNNAGLRWDRGVTSSVGTGMYAPVAYHLWRAGAMSNEPAAPVPESEHRLAVDEPHVVATPTLPAGKTPQRSGDWPSTAMYYIDVGLAEGWYSYRVSGIDLFGRHSAPSPPAVWRQWRPPPEPAPWYYDGSAASDEVNPHAVALLDKLPPPPPTGVEATALDPADPTVVRDKAHDDWFATLSKAEQASVIGLRVQWLWTHAQMRQAPDLAEFRIYWQPGSLNTLTGRITSVSAAASGQTFVDTDIPTNASAGAYKGSYLRTARDSHLILDSKAGSPLRLLVRNVGPGDTRAPIAGKETVVAVAPGSKVFENYARPETWRERIRVVAADDFVAEGVVPARSSSGEELAGMGAKVAASLVTLPPATDLSGVQPYTTHLWLEDDQGRASRTYRVVTVDATADRLTLDGSPVVPGGWSAWELGLLTRRYEVFFPAPGDTDRAGVPLSTSVAVPVAYGNVGVTAVDDKTHTADDSTWSGTTWGGRSGNESEVGGPSMVFRVHREPPSAPAVPEDSDKVYASRADYQNESFYTFRWFPKKHLYCHVYRALDDSLFKADWLIRTTRKALSPTDKAHESCFPQSWTVAQRVAAAQALNGLSSAAGYAALSSDARLALARLPGNEGKQWGAGLEQLDWTIRSSRTALAASDTAYFPLDWANALKRGAAASQLVAIASLDDYDNLSVDALRVLAGLPGNERAFTQITIDPLDPDSSATKNQLGPDNDESFVIDPTLRAYVATLDGRSSNRYFFRAAYVDCANNLSALGLSSPPVHLPDVTPPRAPVFTTVTGGERQINLRWASNREADLAVYRVFRTNSKEDARDVRLMTLVHTESVIQNDPSSRPAEVTWTDDPVPGLVTYYYRVVAVDDAQNASLPTEPVAARAYDHSPPAPPKWEKARWFKVDESGVAFPWNQSGGQLTPGIELVWSTTHARFTCLVERLTKGQSSWSPVSHWFTSTDSIEKDKRYQWSFRDYTIGVSDDYIYRLRLAGPAGTLIHSGEIEASRV